MLFGHSSVALHTGVRIVIPCPAIGTLASRVNQKRFPSETRWLSHKMEAKGCSGESGLDFLTKKPYSPPSWASHLNPLPSHVLSLGHVIKKMNYKALSFIGSS